MSRVVTFDPYAQSLGISFVPVSRSSKNAYHDDWTNPELSFTPDRFRPDDNVGGRWGEPSGGLADIDCDVVHATRICEQVITRGPRYGRLSNRASHYVIRSVGARTKKFVNPITKQMILELRSTGSQSVLPGSIHASGEPYEWERQETPLEFDHTGLTREIAQIAACAFVASLWTGSRHNFALALGGFLAKNQVPLERAKLLVTLITHAAQDEEASDRMRAVTDSYESFANGDEITATFTEVVGEHATLVLKTLADWLGLHLDRYRIFDEAALLNRPAAPFLAKGMLVQGSLVALVSPPDFGKTFLALDLALSIAAAQKTWLGQPLLQSGPVIYVIGEGAGRFKLRLMAWKQYHGITRPLPFFWIDQAVPLIDEKAMHAFLKQAAPIKPVGIVFDTLSRCFVGGDENSASDMGMAMAACDELRARTKAIIPLLHHTRKDGTVERGSSALRGAVDTILTLQEENDARGSLTVSCERQKDAEPFAPIRIKRRVIQLDDVYDDDGNNESSCVIELATAEDFKATQETRTASILEFIRIHPGMTKTQITKEIGGRKTTVMKAIEELIRTKQLRIQSKGETQFLYPNVEFSY